MFKIARAPDQSSYTTQLPGALSVILESPASSHAQDVYNNSRFVNVQWQWDEAGYQYIRSFFRTGSKKGSIPFNVDLIIDGSAPVEYVAKFVEGTFKLASMSIGSFVVQATLEVKCLPVNDNYEESAFVVYQAFGEDAQNALNLFNQIVNVNWPV